MDRAYFIKLFEFDHWANEKALKALEAAPPPVEEALRKMSHILLVKKLWFSRLTPEVTAADMDQVLTIAECSKLDREMLEKAEGYLSKIDEARLSGKVAYKNRKGVPFETVLADILTQVITHGSYHRGQIASLIKRSGGTPPETDYVRFVSG